MPRREAVVASIVADHGTVDCRSEKPLPARRCSPKSGGTAPVGASLVDVLSPLAGAAALIIPL